MIKYNKGRIPLKGEAVDLGLELEPVEVLKAEEDDFEHGRYVVRYRIGKSLSSNASQPSQSLLQLSEFSEVEELPFNGDNDSHRIDVKHFQER